MTSKFLIRSLIAAVALTAVCEVPAQSKKVQRSTSSPAVVLKGEQGERVRVRLEEALELLRDGEASGEARERAIAALKAAMTELKKGDGKHADLLYRYAKTLRPDAVDGDGERLENVRKRYIETLGRLAKGAAKAKGKAKKDKNGGKAAGVRAADLLQRVQGRIIDSEGRPVAGSIVLDTESGEPVVGRILGEHELAKDYIEKVSKVTYGFFEDDDDDEKQGKGKKGGKSKKKGGVAYYVDGDGDDKVVYGRLDDDGRILALKRPDKDHVIYGRLDDDGRIVGLKRAKKGSDSRVFFGRTADDGHEVAKVKKSGLSFLSDGGDEVVSGSGGDADIVKAIQGVRDELRAIRKLMAKAHATMDGDHGDADGAKTRSRYRVRDPRAGRRGAFRFKGVDGDGDGGERVFFGRDATDRAREVRREVIKSLRRRGDGDEQEHDRDNDAAHGADDHDSKAKSPRPRWVEKSRASTGDNGWRVQLDSKGKGKGSKGGEWFEIDPQFQGLGVHEGNVFQWRVKGGGEKAEPEARDRKSEFKARWRDVLEQGEGEGDLFWVRQAAKEKDADQAEESRQSNKAKKSQEASAKDGWVTLKKSKSKGSVR